MCCQLPGRRSPARPGQKHTPTSPWSPAFPFPLSAVKSEMMSFTVNTTSRKSPKAAPHKPTAKNEGSETPPGSLLSPVSCFAVVQSCSELEMLFMADKKGVWLPSQSRAGSVSPVNPSSGPLQIRKAFREESDGRVYLQLLSRKGNQG